MLTHGAVTGVSYQQTQCDFVFDFSSVAMNCDLSGVADTDPLHLCM